MIRKKVLDFPENPGCYIMRNIDNKVIYVGKAKNLKKRVLSYFTGAQNTKTQQLVLHIFDIEYIITKNEKESLILELNLIKEYYPKYNILLKDDKTFPYIVLTREKYPRLIYQRLLKKGKDTYFGPYTKSYNARVVVEILNKIYPLRKCITLPKKECLYYHIKQCDAPCIKEIDQNKQQTYIKEITDFLQNKDTKILKDMQLKMLEYSNNLEFEKALEIKKDIDMINILKEEQNIELPDNINRDIIGQYYIEDFLIIQIFQVRFSKIIARESYVIDKIESKSEIYSFLLTYYNFNELPEEIIIDNVDEQIMSNYIPVTCVIPKIGFKKELLKQANINAVSYYEQYLQNKDTKLRRNQLAIEELRNLLNLEVLNLIEVFDNSNIAQTNKVSAMIVFENLKFNKQKYRKYKIKSEANDDLGMFEEVLYRRYFKMLKEKTPRPDLVIMDGGQNQVNTAIKTLNKFYLDIPVIGLKKDSKHKTESIIYNNREYKLEKNTLLYQLMYALQEEVHRFAITFFQKTMSTNLFKSSLDEIDGIGEKTRIKLLKEFKDIKIIEKLNVEQLNKCVDIKKATAIFEYFKERNK